MNKKLLIGILFLLIMGLLWFLEPSTGDNSNQLAETVTGVATNNGTLTFQNGTLIGGDPDTYITLTQSRTFLVATGSAEYPSGTKVDCNPPPGYPNPCILS